ncbi:hypothetical protein TNCV_1345581 [Trichonephila clavipes]|nr:hypothetical protein TNCV_1345581 [Trichonephila clavipes]
MSWRNDHMVPSYSIGSVNDNHAPIYVKYDSRPGKETWAESLQGLPGKTRGTGAHVEWVEDIREFRPMQTPGKCSRTYLLFPGETQKHVRNREFSTVFTKIDR